MKKMIILGISDLARLMYYYFINDSKYEIAAFTVNKEYIENENPFLGLPVVPFEDVKNKYPPNDYLMFIAIGYKEMRNRKVLYDIAKDKGYELANYISSKAIIYDNLEVGENNVIMGNVQIEPFVKIGNNNIFWSDTLICHDTRIKDHNFFSGKTLVGGLCKVENGSFLGFNSTVIQKLNIADESLIAAKSLLLHDTVKYGKYVGIPAKKTEEHKKEGIIISD